MDPKTCRCSGKYVSIKDVFEDTGWMRAEWEKKDPRGSEYGSFKAYRRRSDGNIEVHHTKDSYTMVFETDQSFKNWCSVNT